MAVQIERENFVFSNRNVLGNIVQKRHGLVLRSQADRVGESFVVLATNRGHVLTFLDAVRAVSFFGRNKAIGAVVLGDALVERAA